MIYFSSEHCSVACSAMLKEQQWKQIPLCFNFCISQAPVTQRLADSIHQIDHYPGGGGGGGLLPYMGYIGMCGPKGRVFQPVRS